MQRAEEVFNHLGMYQTQLHNAVLLYIATESKKFAILGDTFRFSFNIAERDDESILRARAKARSE